MRPLERLESRRLFSTGDIDPTFGISGGVELSQQARQMITATAGKVLLVADTTITRASATDLAADAAFGSQGTVDFSGEFDQVYGVIALSSEKVLVGGYGHVGAGGPVAAKLMRLNANGSTDQTFGTNGVATFAAAPGAAIQGYNIERLAEGPDGKIVYSGYIEGSGQVRRANADGSPDPSFTPFKFDIQGPTARPRVQSDGEVILGGNFRKAVRAPGDEGKFFTLARLNGDGSLDTTFGDAVGYVAGKFGDSVSFLVLPDDRILEAGYRAGVSYVTRRTPDGQLDGTFGTHGGTTPMNFGTSNRLANGEIRIASSGHIVAAGFNAIGRFSADGIPDESFGRVLVSNRSVLPQPDGDLLVLTSGIFGNQVVRLQGSPGGPDGPVSIAGATVTAVGTDLGDHVGAGLSTNSFGDAVSIQIQGGVEFGRAYDAADVTTINISLGGGRDTASMSVGTVIRTSISGGDGDDTLTGGPGEESISGNAGNDQIGGLGGNDRLAGNGGRDVVFGNEGDDRLYGGSSADVLVGEAGNDSLYGEGGNDMLDGGQGADFVHGNAGDDRINAAENIVGVPNGVDSILGDGGRDRAFGGAEDILTSIEVKSGTRVF